MSKPELHLVSESGTGLRHFHAALRRMASGLCVVTAGHDDDISGVTVASLTSLSIEPPRLLINLSQHASVCRLIARDRWFGINILGSDQLALADRFSTPRLTGPQRFEGLAWSPGASGVPLLGHAQAAIECETDEIMERYAHAIIVGRPSEITLAPQLSSLLYWNEQYVEIDRNADLDLLADVSVPMTHVR
jgi:flavin reductase (DIM6/NTAB) family NADH-FMN oxidoreductase RutF